MQKILAHPFLNEGMLFHIMDDRGVLFYTLITIGCVIIPYLLGSINFAVIISSKRYNDDVRTHGSGNAGMTNMMRTYGRRSAVLTLVGDALKAVVAALYGYFAFGLIGAHMAGFFCVLGHLFPIFFNFKGGKGVATTAASMLMCNPVVFLIDLILFVLIVAIWRYISLASIMAALLYPIILNGVDSVLGGGSGIYIVFPMLITVLVVLKHRDNIKRLLSGKENKFSFKKSVKKPDGQDENNK